MDDKTHKCCPNCFQLYYIKNQSSGLKGNLPLLLSCGHTICENCVRSLTKFQEPIQCKICLQYMKMKAADILTLAADKSELYQLFPVNMPVLGELTLQLMNDGKKSAEPVEECFIDIQGIMMDEDTFAECEECQIRTVKMCKQCDLAICETCFNKTHKNYLAFKHHVLQKIVSTGDTNNNCKVHGQKQLEYYCIDCCKAICLDCLLTSYKSCKDHNLKSTAEINDARMKELMDIQPKVDETFRRLTKTAVDIGQQLYNIDNGIDTPSEITQTITAIEQHFSKLCAITQKHKKETIALATKVTSAERNSLVNAKNEVFDALKKAKSVMSMISAIANTTKFTKMNLSVLLEDAKKVTGAPWFLLKVEDNTNAFKIKVNEDLNALISEYIHLEENAASAYKLCMPEDLEGVEIPPPPPLPVYPPQLPRDERQKQIPILPPPQPEPKRGEETSKPFNYYEDIPMFRRKNSSVNSVNTGRSNTCKQSSKPDITYQSLPRTIPHTQGLEPRQPLVEGSKELVYISHIVDPHDFFVQRASDQKLVKDVLMEHRNSGSEPKPLLGNVAKGKIYVVFSKADNLWQRCRVLSVEEKDIKQPRFTVYCFDFGHIETVSIHNLRLLPPAKWYTPPPLAIHCSLANCTPIIGKWMNEDSILIKNILDNKQALIHVRRVIETEEDTKLDCDVITYEQKVSLAHAFEFHERAKIINPRLTYPIINTVNGSPKIIISNSDFVPKSIYDSYFTHIVSPDKFFVIKKQHQSDYYKISKELDQEYSLGLDCGKIFLPELGMACVVNMENNRNVVDNNPILGEDVTWARCVVTELATRGRVRVRLVDLGPHLLVHSSSLRAIHSKFTKMRALATECHLAGVTPHNVNWSPASVALLKKYQHKVIEIEVRENRPRCSIGVCLFDKTDEKNVICVNNEMVNYKLAIKFGIFNFTRNTEDLKDQSFSYQSPLDKPTQQPKPKCDKIKILKRINPESAQIQEQALVAIDKGPLKLEAKILNYISPASIYLTLVYQQESLNEMFANIQKYYKEEKTEGKTEWQVGDQCCTLAIQSRTWHRASILELDGANAKVFYVDFATIETVQASGLKVLAPEFASICYGALNCHLSGVMPAIGDEWPSISKEFLKELLDAYNRVFITTSGDVKDNSMPVEFWVYHTIQGGALEADVSEWRCLNMKIIEQGLGIPIKSEHM